MSTTTKPEDVKPEEEVKPEDADAASRFRCEDKTIRCKAN